jgi:hypothetical protein
MIPAVKSNVIFCVAPKGAINTKFNQAHYTLSRLTRTSMQNITRTRRDINSMQDRELCVHSFRSRTFENYITDMSVMNARVK